MVLEAKFIKVFYSQTQCLVFESNPPILKKRLKANVFTKKFKIRRQMLTRRI